MLTLLISLSLAGWGAERAVNPTTGLVDSRGDTWSSSAVGWSNAGFLVAWQDARFAGAPVVMVSRVTIDGGTLDPVGVVVSSFNAAHPSVSTRGPVAAIAWEAPRSSYFRLMRDDATFASAAIPFGGRCPAVALSGVGGVVVSENGALQARRFDSTGAWVDAAPLELAPSVPWATCARVSMDASGQHALVLWHDTNTNAVFSASLQMSGPPTMPVTVGMGAGSGAPALVSVGDDAWFGAAAWTPTPPMVQLSGYALSSTTATSVPFLPSAAWLGLELAPCALGVCFAATQDGTNVTLNLGAVPLDGGALVTAMQLPVNSADLALAATTDGTHLALVASDYSGTEVAVGGTDFVQAAPLLTVTRSQPAQLEPDVAVLGSVALVAWIEFDSASGDAVVRGKRYDTSGTELDATPLTLIDPGGDLLTEVELMTGDGEWVIGASAWGNESSYLVRLSSAGVLGPQRKLAARGLHGGFVLAGNDVLLTLKQYQTTWWDPVLVTIAPDGTEVTTRLQDNAPKEHFTDVALTGSGERLAVWQDVDPDGNVDAIVAGKRMDASGALLDTTAIRFTPAGTAEAFEPQIVGDGRTGYFLVFHSYRQAWAMHLEGTSSSAPLPLLATPLDSESPQHLNLVQVGKHALVSFSNPSDGTVVMRELEFEAGTLTATPLESLGDTGFQAWPATTVGPDAVWAAYARADLTRNAMQVFVRVFPRLPDGSPCGGGWQCTSGVCSGTCLAPPPPTDGGMMMTMTDGGAANESSDAGASRTERRRLGLGFSCAAVDGASVWMLSALLVAWRRARGGRT